MATSYSTVNFALLYAKPTAMDSFSEIHFQYSLRILIIFTQTDSHITRTLQYGQQTGNKQTLIVTREEKQPLNLPSFWKTTNA